MSFSSSSQADPNLVRDNTYFQHKRLHAAIDECQESIEKLLVMGESLNTNNYMAVRKLLRANAFDQLSMEKILILIERPFDSGQRNLMFA
ncbi:MAG: hypothetical protein AAF502_03350 [Bacteroidota bacterium]